jgi:LPXTG-motif cell wall-anchored protein
MSSIRTNALIKSSGACWNGRTPTFTLQTYLPGRQDPCARMKRDHQMASVLPYLGNFCSAMLPLQAVTLCFFRGAILTCSCAHGGCGTLALSPSREWMTSGSYKCNTGSSNVSSSGIIGGLALVALAVSAVVTFKRRRAHRYRFEVPEQFKAFIRAIV